VGADFADAGGDQVGLALEHKEDARGAGLELALLAGVLLFGGLAGDAFGAGDRGALFLETGLTYEKGNTGKIPHWRGIYDDHGRLIVVMCHNMDLGDSWEHADNPLYPEKYSALGIRIALNYITYSMTH
jgi:Domain of unknown function (DUF4159)